MASFVINTREDLDKIQGTPEYNEFMNRLRGSMSIKVDVQIYPENYNDPDYDGPKLEPVWDELEDLSTIERFGFTKADFS